MTLLLTQRRSERSEESLHAQHPSPYAPLCPGPRDPSHAQDDARGKGWRGDIQDDEAGSPQKRKLPAEPIERQE